MLLFLRLVWAPLALCHHYHLFPFFSSFPSSLFCSLCCAQVEAFATRHRESKLITLDRPYPEHLETNGCLHKEQTWSSWIPPVLSSSSFFFMSVSQLSSSLMKLCRSSAFCRIWSCNSMALFPPDMLFPVKQTFVLDQFLTLVVAAVVFLNSVLQTRGNTRITLSCFCG